MTPAKDFVAAAFVAAAVTIPVNFAAAQSADQSALQTLAEETRIGAVLQELQKSAPAGRVAITNVRIVDPDAGEVKSGQAAIVSRAGRGRIVWVGDAADMPRSDKLTVIDGENRYLAPGLADMHVHSSSLSEWLLDLANGVTTVRDMDGFPWLLEARQAVNDGRMLAPTIYLAATIINAYPLQGYAVVPANPADARRIVREQAACGYDFIKIHNVLPRPMFDAVVEQAKALGMDLIGHVPHDIDLAHALHAMRTTEHLKGFIIDRTLLPNETDFAKALKGAETWITPTLYTRVAYTRGEDARAILESPQARYVSAQTRALWRGVLADSSDSETTDLGARLRSSQDEVMARLVPLKPKWLAGTDAAGYAFNIMGFALIEELRLLQNDGLSPADALRAATVEPARAMREGDEFGEIKVGMRADLVLLDKNPLEDPTAYSANAGVMVRGLWLSRKRLNTALNALASIYADDTATPKFNKKAKKDLVAKTASLTESGYVISAPILRDAASALEATAQRDAQRLRELTPKFDQPPCGVETP